MSGTVGVGGAAGLTANTLAATSINLTKNDGALTFNVTTLDVTGGNTTLNLDGTTTAGVNIGNVTLGGGNTFTATSANNGAARFDTLNVSGAANGLTGNYAGLAFTNVIMEAGSGLAPNVGGAPLQFTNMRVRGRNVLYEGALNAVGKNLLFDLPADLAPGQTLLTVSGAADLTGARIGLNDPSGRPNVTLGESLTLLDAQAGGITGFADLTVRSAGGDTYVLTVSGTQLLAMLQALSPNTPAYERLKAFAEGRAAALAFIDQGADLLLNQGFGAARFATSGPGFQFGSFAAGSGGWSRYNTGSHIDVSGASMLAGVAFGNDAGPGRITAGLFLEGGWGNYNSYNSFSNYAAVNGDGNVNYYGGGLLARYDLTGGAARGLYGEASARMGRADMDFTTGDIRYNGSKANFDSASMYWGAHAGLGYRWSFSEKAMLDISGKFIWTRQDGDNVTAHEDKARFAKADSLRTRLGGRFNYALNEYVTPYAGLYWEHEFDGRQHSSVNGISLAAPSLKGDTGVGELGLTIKPVKDSGFSIDVSAYGYTGVREGVTGSLQFKLEF